MDFFEVYTPARMYPNLLRDSTEGQGLFSTGTGDQSSVCGVITHTSERRTDLYIGKSVFGI